MLRVLIIRSNSISYDVRVLKEARVLSNNGFLVNILGWDRENKFPLQEKLGNIIIHRVKNPAGYGLGWRNIFRLFRWQFLEFSYLLKNNADIIHACDFDTIIPSYIVARLKHKKIIYDIFDFYADSLIGVPPILKAIISKIDLFFIKRVDAVILCDDSRKDEIHYQGRRVYIFYNTPNDVLMNMKLKFNDTNKRPFVLCYIGHLDNKLRDLDQFIQAIKGLKNVILKIGGFGVSEKQIIKKAQEVSFIKFVGRLDYNKALEEEYNSDVIICPYDPSLVANIYASPNKLFEAMMLAKPIIINRGLKITKLVQQYNTGAVFNYGNIDSLKQAILTLQRNPALSKSMGAHARKLYEEKYSFKKNTENLLNAYKHCNFP